jgi:RNA polymerase sigma factor (sigma-70 family)
MPPTEHPALSGHLIDMSGIALEGTAVAPIVRLAASGDQAAFTRIVAAFHPDLIRVAFVVAGGDQEVAEDAVQAAWAIAWRKLSGVRQPERVKGWLLAVAANEARQIMRRRRTPIVEIGMAEHQQGGRDPDASADELDLQDALRHLSADDRALLALRYDAGLDSGEIGVLTGRTAASVRGHLARVLARLRRELSDA